VNFISIADTTQKTSPGSRTPAACAMLHVVGSIVKVVLCSELYLVQRQVMLKKLP
jgi:hypothetical protein